MRLLTENNEKGQEIFGVPQGSAASRSRLALRASRSSLYIAGYVKFDDMGAGIVFYRLLKPPRGALAVAHGAGEQALLKPRRASGVPGGGEPVRHRPGL